MSDASPSFDGWSRYIACLLTMLTWSSTSNARDVMGISCNIEALSIDDLLRIDAVVRTQVAAAGRYQLSIIKVSPSGTSQNAQSGTFDLKSATAAVLTSVILDSSAVGQYRATLTIESDQGSVSCVSP
jgi:hypothetical protein